jgi:polyisoprenoid-binding protein YceI
VAVTSDYEIDPMHTRIGFAVRHAMVTKVRGHFNEFFGTAFLDGDDPCRSWVKMTIATASIFTGQEQRDAHLRSPDFLDVETYPEMLFDSTKVEHVAGDRYRMIGELTVRDTTRPVSIDFTFGGTAVDPSGDQRAGFEGTTRISRKAFGLTWNMAMENGFLIGDEVALQFDVAAVRITEPAFLR